MGALFAAIGLQSLGLFAEASPWTGDAMPLLAISALVQALVVTAVLLRRRHAEERVQRVSDARSQLLLDHVGDCLLYTSRCV